MRLPPRSATATRIEERLARMEASQARTEGMLEQILGGAGGLSYSQCATLGCYACSLDTDCAEGNCVFEGATGRKLRFGFYTTGCCRVVADA